MFQQFEKPSKGASNMIMRFKVDRKSGIIVIVWDFGGQKVGHSRYMNTLRV